MKFLKGLELFDYIECSFIRFADNMTGDRMETYNARKKAL